MFLILLTDLSLILFSKFSNFVNYYYLSYSVKKLDIQVSIYVFLMSKKDYQDSFFSYFFTLIEFFINFYSYVLEPIYDSLAHLFFSLIFDNLYTLFNDLGLWHVNFFSQAALITSLKFILLIALLVIVRGGIPRYRFDYLTKLGWTKFLSLILLSFLLELCLMWIL